MAPKITAVQTWKTSDGVLHESKRKAETEQFWLDFQDEMRKSLKDAGYDPLQLERMVKFLCLVEPLRVRDVLSKYISKAKGMNRPEINTQMGIKPANSVV